MFCFLLATSLFTMELKKGKGDPQLHHLQLSDGDEVSIGLNKY